VFFAPDRKACAFFLPPANDFSPFFSPPIREVEGPLLRFCDFLFSFWDGEIWGSLASPRLQRKRPPFLRCGCERDKPLFSLGDPSFFFLQTTLTSFLLPPPRDGPADLFLFSDPTGSSVLGHVWSLFFSSDVEMMEHYAFFLFHISVVRRIVPPSFRRVIVSSSSLSSMAVLLFSHLRSE